MMLSFNNPFSCLSSRTLLIIKYVPIVFKWVFWTIHNYNYKISGAILNNLIS